MAFEACWFKAAQAQCCHALTDVHTGTQQAHHALSTCPPPLPAALPATPSRTLSEQFEGAGIPAVPAPASLSLQRAAAVASLRAAAVERHLQVVSVQLGGGAALSIPLASWLLCESLIQWAGSWQLAGERPGLGLVGGSRGGGGWRRAHSQQESCWRAVVECLQWCARYAPSPPRRAHRRCRRLSPPPITSVCGRDRHGGRGPAARHRGRGRRRRPARPGAPDGRAGSGQQGGIVAPRLEAVHLA